MFFLCSGLRGADKSGVSPNTISLPKGPGSIEGLGESFQPTLNTGTAKYGIKLTVPPGTGGNAPEFAFRYEGGGGNSVLGFGWSLPSAYVQRRSDEGIPTYGENVGFPRDDVFINEAKEELVPTADGFYFCKNEAAFIRYRQVGDHWEATTPEGTRLEFGVSLTARVHDGAGRVFCWMLERETDTRGNTITYSYTSFSGGENLNQVYLETIRYGPGAPPWANFHFVRFAYEARADWFEDCRSGFPVRTGKRLRSVIIGTQGPSLAQHLPGDFDGDGTTDYLVRRYDLEYLAYAGASSHWSLLSRITQVGADGVTALPPATFGYTVCDPPEVLSAASHFVGGINEPTLVMDSPFVDFVDLNGDGLPDVLRTGGPAHIAYLNQGEKLAAGERAMQWEGPVDVDAQSGGAWNYSLDANATHLADMNGDGLADLVHKSGLDTVFYFENRGTVQWAESQPMTAQFSLPPAPFGVPDVRTADVDFDKRTDLIRGDGLQYQVWFNFGTNQYSEPFTVPNEAAFDFSQPTVQVADLNGDRIPDLAQVRPTSVELSVGLGYGRFASRVQVAIPDETLDESQVQKAKLMDITGDGLADLVIERAAPGELWYWLNLGTYSFSPRKTITGMPSGVGVNAAIRWADINGNGTTDLIYTDSASEPRLQTVDLGELIVGGASPNVLTEISNGIGRITQIGYESSTVFRLADAAAGRPWPDPVPFPVQVVGSVTNLDSLGGHYVTQFRYHDGYYDPVEKQFRGFARVEQIDLGDPTAPTLVTRSHFDTGRDFEIMKGRLIRLTAEQEDGAAFSDQSTAWLLPPKTLAVGTNGVEISYAHPVSSTNIIKELGQGIERRLEMEMDYDDYGNQTREANYGIVDAGSRSAFDDERIVVTDFAINTEAWLLRFPKQTEIKDEHGVVLSRSQFFYDEETFSGNNWGIVSIGNLTMKRDWIDASNTNAFITSARTKYDAFGNPVTLLDPLAVAPGGAVDRAKGHVRDLTFDPRFHTFPITETIHVGNGSEALVFQASYDEGFGTVTSSTDFNGNITSYGYDTFARLTSIVKPGDTAEYPTAEYDYLLAEPFTLGSGIEGVINYVETRQLDQPISAPGSKRDHYFISRQFVDGLGRKRMTKTEAEPAEGSNTPRVVVTEATLFNARQKPGIIVNPFFSSMGETLVEQLGFEELEAPDWQGQFHDTGNLVALDLDSAHKVTTEYDATLRPIRVVNPDGTYSRTVYEPLVTRSFDENDVDPASQYFDTPMVHHTDGLERLIQVDEITRLTDDGLPAGNLRAWITRYRYDLNDQLTHIIDSQNNLKTFSYDALKRKVHMNDPNRGVMHFVYDDASNLVETEDAKEQRITYTYDGANRIRTEDYHDEAEPFSAGFAFNPAQPITREHRPDVAYFYDVPVSDLPQGDNTLATATNVKGMLAYVWDLAGEEHTSYDARGRVRSVVKRIPDPKFISAFGFRYSDLVSYRTAFDYDSLDRLTRLVYPDLDEINHEYNQRSLLRRIPGGPSGAILSNIVYQASAQNSRIDYGNGVRTTYAYDPRLRLKNLLTVGRNSSGGPEEFINFWYDFDGVSNIRMIEDRRPGSAVPAGDPRRNTQLYQYDDLYRLTRAQYSFELPGQPKRDDGVIDYRYDRIGNMLAQTSTMDHQEKGIPVVNVGEMHSGGDPGRWNRTGRTANDPPGPHALTKITPLAPIGGEGQGEGERLFPYDANGNMTDIDGLLCIWDFKDRLVAAESFEMRAEYAYDYTDRRIMKRVAWKPGYPLESNGAIGKGEGRPTSVAYVNKYFEVRENDAPTKYVWNGSTRVARVTGSLNTNLRIQRLRVWPGWNLASLAVSGSLSADGGEVVSSAFKWDSAGKNWLPLTAGASLPAGTVLWFQATTNATLTITGPYSDATDREFSAGGDFIPAPGLEPWNFRSAISQLPAARASKHDAYLTSWVSWLPPPLDSQSDLPAFIAPGQAVFILDGASTQLEVPDAALRTRYYHQDHIGSSAVISTIVAESTHDVAYYPFGAERSMITHCDHEQPYRFGRGEGDSESRLTYLSSRLLAPRLSRFTSVDPIVKVRAGDNLLAPKRQQGYAYCENNPLSFVDDSGRSSISTAKRSLPEIAQDFEGVPYGLRETGEPVPVLLADGTLASGKLNCTTYVGAVLSIWMNGRIDAALNASGNLNKKNTYSQMTSGANKGRNWPEVITSTGATIGASQSGLARKDFATTFSSLSFNKSSAVLIQVTDKDGSSSHVALAFYDQGVGEWRVTHAAGSGQSGEVITQSLADFQKRMGQKGTFSVLEIEGQDHQQSAAGSSNPDFPHATVPSE